MAHDLPAVVDQTAAVAGEQSAGGNVVQIAEWVDSILHRRIMPFVSKRGAGAMPIVGLERQTPPASEFECACSGVEARVGLSPRP